ncbi:MAG: cell division protein FtsZ [Oscillospiraceae bacterium]|jgi:cell division protein FtsZ|nr:cell division protein FtsZ [Oscillospiraceae bacterium]
MAIVYENEGYEEYDDIDNLDDAIYDVKIKVFGIGGGGCNALEYMAKQGVANVEYVAVNTDVPALRSKDKRLMRRLQIGKKRTKGRGAGGDPEVGCESAREDRAEIERCLDGTSMVFISAGMGGGTGTGAAPVIAEIAKENEILTIGVVTKPFDFERQQKMNTALKGIAEMRKHVDALIIIPNQKLLKINERAINSKAAFEMVDDVLYKVVNSISELLNTTSDVNVDFADLNAVLQDSGDAHIAIGTGTGDNKADDAVSQVINSPLLETSINNAGKILVHIAMSEDTLLQEVDLVVNKLTEAAHSDVEVTWGWKMDSSLKDTIVVTAVATSFRDEPSLAKRVESVQQKQPSQPKPANAERDERDERAFRHKAEREKPPETNEEGEKPLSQFITQNLSGNGFDDDPYQALEEIFKKK